jgi:hypothetical protein
MASILPKGKTQFLNLLGRPLVGGKVYFYLPDTETKKDTWQDPEMTIPNTNPIVLDARGEAVIWGEGSYRQVVKDVLGITIWDQETSSSVSDIALSGPGGSALVGTPDGSTIADQFRTRLNRVVDSIAELRALDHAESTRAFVTGYYEASDGGGGAYQYDPDDASSLDNGVTVIVATDGARWKLQYHNVLSLEQGGAKGDGTTDDTTAIQNLMNAVSALGGGTVYARKSYYTASGFIVQSNVSLIGPRENPGAETSGGTGVSYDGTEGVFFLGAGATIQAGFSSSIRGVTILAFALKGLLPFATSAAATSAIGGFAGVGITVSGDDVDLRNNLILGFATGVYSSGHQRVTADLLKIDCTNGIDIQNTADVCKISRCHCWPFLTGYLSFAGGTALVTRSGFAYRFKSVADWSEHISCSSYGFYNGFIYDGVNAVSNIQGAADYPSGLATNGAGFLALNATTNLNLIGPRAEGQSYGVFVNTTNASTVTGTGINVIGGTFWTLGIAGVRVQAGKALVKSCHFYNITAAGSQGVSLGPSSIQNGGCTVSDNTFDAVNQTPIGVDATGQGVHQIFDNTFYRCSDSFGGQAVYDNTSAQNLSYTFSTGNGANNRLRKARGTAAAPAILSGGDSLGTWEMDAYDGTAYRSAVMIRGTVGAAMAANVVPGRMIFSVSLGSTASTDTTIIDELGALRPVTDNAYTLGSASARWSTVYAATGTINTSDANTKTDIADATLGADFIDALRPVSYKFKIGGTEVVRQVFRDQSGNECDPSADGATPAEIITQDRAGIRTHWGLLAQEVKAVVDAAGVDFAGWTLADPSDPNSQQGLRYDQFIAPLIKASQQDRGRIKTLETTAADLLARIEKLEGDAGAAQPA